MSVAFLSQHLYKELISNSCLHTPTPINLFKDAKNKKYEQVVLVFLEHINIIIFTCIHPSLSFKSSEFLSGLQG
jgi:hypothetical protein